jgi:hypothetical protein
LRRSSFRRNVAVSIKQIVNNLYVHAVFLASFIWRADG